MGKPKSHNSNIDTTTNIQPGNRISWLDILRGIGIILMVYGHINYIVPVYTWIYSFHMPLFFFAAGVVYKEHPIIKDFLHRALTILVPYLFFGIITLLYWHFAERHYKPSDLSFIDALKGLLIGNEDALDFNIPLWFLPCFFLTLILYNLVRRFFSTIARRAPKGVHQFISFVICIGLSLVYSFDLLKVLPWGIDRIPKYIIFVSLGEIAANILTTPQKDSGKVITQRPSVMARIFIFLLSLAFLFASIQLSQKLDYNETRYQWFIVSIIGCAFITLLSIAISNSRILELCGQTALVILCIHGTIYRALVYSLTHITDKTMEWIRTTPIIIVTLTLISIGFCILLRMLMLLPLRKHKI